MANIQNSFHPKIGAFPALVRKRAGFYLALCTISAPVRKSAGFNLTIGAFSALVRKATASIRKCVRSPPLFEKAASSKRKFGHIDPLQTTYCFAEVDHILTHNIQIRETKINENTPFQLNKCYFSAIDGYAHLTVLEVYHCLTISRQFLGRNRHRVFYEVHLCWQQTLRNSLSLNIKSGKV